MRDSPTGWQYSYSSWDVRVIAVHVKPEHVIYAGYAFPDESRKKLCYVCSEVEVKSLENCQ